MNKQVVNKASEFASAYRLKVRTLIREYKGVFWTTNYFPIHLSVKVRYAGLEVETEKMNATVRCVIHHSYATNYQGCTS